MNTGLVIFIVLLLAILGYGVAAYMKKWFPFKKSTGRKYDEVKDKSESGKCSGTGTTAKATKSSECSAACDAAPPSAPCSGYDWDDTTCTLYGTAPTSATYTKGGKDKCYALSSK